MTSNTSKVAPPREWLSLKQLQRYSHLSEKIIQGWIRQPADPLPVTSNSGSNNFLTRLMGWGKSEDDNA
jgi:hypothetical protein